MFQKQSRWRETLINTKTDKPPQKKGGKDQAASALPVRGRQAGSSASKSSGSCARSSSLSARGGDSGIPVSKAGSSLKRGSLVHQGARPASRPARPALHLCSSRSFSSLHSSSLPAAPFRRSSRSLNRLDQRSTGDDCDDVGACSGVKGEQLSENRELDCGQLSSSQDQIRSVAEEARGDDGERMETSSTSESLELLPTGVSTTACVHHCNKVKKQTKDGVYTLCAMTSGMRRNWVQAVLKNVRPSPSPDGTSPSLELKSESVSEEEHTNSCLQEPNTSECADDSHQQQQEQGAKLQPETQETSADEGSESAPRLSSSPPLSTSPVNHTHLREEGAGSDSCVPPVVMSNDDEHSNVDVKASNSSSECAKEMEKQASVLQTGQLVKELEQTQRELSRLQQLNRNLQHELQQERESHAWERVGTQKDLSPSEHTLAFQRLQKINHDLRFELEAQKRTYEEAREAELRRRVDLLAQQAQLLVTGDATALAQTHLEQDRRRFREQQTELECSVASLKTQLSASEEQRLEAEAHLVQLQQGLQGYGDLQQEADQLRKNLQEVTAQIRAIEEAQAQKEARLQNHLALLQASQDRERRSLAASLAQAEQLSHGLQERLDRAEQQVESLSKTETLTKEIEEAQQQLQEELACTISTVQRLQEEREQLDRRCQEQQNQLSEADEAMSRMQSRLKTEETHYYNLEHSYERVSEDLQLALGTVQQKEVETQDMREGYERLLDRKEQELSEVLLKMEVLGNSLEETESKLHEVMRECTCACEQKPSELARQSEEEGTQPSEDGESSESSNAGDVQTNSSSHVRARSLSVGPSHQHIVSAGDDPERFMSVIQLLETKLYVTEEKLRDITQRLEEHQGDVGCQDPQLCSQLTRSRAAAQHLGLLLHSQAKRSQRFAQETESRCRTLAGRFQVALGIVQSCREKLRARHAAPGDIEMQLATAAAYLQQGERDAERQQQESYNAGKVEERIINDGALVGAEGDTLSSDDSAESVGKYLMRELVTVQKMVAVLKSQNGISQPPSVPRDDEGDAAHRHKLIISRIIASNKTPTGREDCDILESAIGRVCAEAELIYAALKLQQQCEAQRSGLADIDPPELAPYEEQFKVGAAKPLGEDESSDKKAEGEEKPNGWLEGLVTRLQRRAKFLSQLCRDGGSADPNCGSAADLNWMQQQAKLIYLSDRLHLDFEQELQRCEASRDKLLALCKQQDVSLKDEQEAFNHTVCELQEDNSALREELERAGQKIISVEGGNQRLLEDIQKIEDYHKERMQTLETQFREKIQELQRIHEEEMKHLHDYHTKYCAAKEKQSKCCTDTHSAESPASSSEQREACQSSCDPGFTVMEEMHRKLIGDLQQQHEKKMEALMKEKDQLLQDETAATMAAIVAMRRAHREELEKTRRSQHMMEGADMVQLHTEYEKGMQLLHKELEVLSLQHTQKCLENSQLSQELQDERKSLMQYQKENQELKKKQRETEETSCQGFSSNGEQPHAASQPNDFYEMEVILRAREAEMQFLRQEARSLREELKIARMDKIYAQNKLKSFYTNSPDQGVNRLENVKFATWAGRDAPGPSSDDAVANPSSAAAYLKKADKSSLTRQIRGMRSKSLKEGLSVQERLKLFESF